MKTSDFTTTILVDGSPVEAFDAINNVRGWWSGNIEGRTEKLNDEFTYRYRQFHYSKQRLIEVVPGQMVVWQVTDSSLNFVKNKNEWTGTKIIFEISEKGGKTQIRFTHQGLIPERECFDACSNGWTEYINGSLYNLISSGIGKPNRKEKKLS